MFIYWAIFVFVLLLFFFNKTDEPKYTRFFLFVIFVEIVFGGMRSVSVGTDTQGYIDTFYNISSNGVFDVNASRLTSRDFVFWNVFGRIYMWTNETVVFFILSILCWTLFACSLKDFTQNIYLSLLIYIAFRFSDFYLNAMRQGPAVALVLLSMTFVLKRKLVQFLVSIFIASLFHKTALIVLPLYWIYYVDISKFNRLFLLILLVVFFIFRRFLYDKFFIYLITQQYELYKNVEESHGILYYSLYLVTTVVCILFFDKSDRIMSCLLLFAVIGTCFQSICLVNMAFARISNYFTQSFVLLVPAVYSYICHIKGKTIPTIFVTVFLIMLYILGGPAPGIVPYSFFWQC